MTNRDLTEIKAVYSVPSLGKCLWCSYSVAIKEVDKTRRTITCNLEATCTDFDKFHEE